MFALYTKCGHLILPIDIIIELFDRVIAPILLYFEIFRYNNWTKINVIQRLFSEPIVKLSTATLNEMIYGETGTIPLSITINKQMINTKLINNWRINLSKLDIEVTIYQYLKYTRIINTLFMCSYFAGIYISKQVLYKYSQCL